MKLSITIRNHLRAMKFHIIGTVLMLIALYFLNWDIDAVIIFAFFWLAYFIPAIFLHLEYYLRNRVEQLEIFENEIILHDRVGQVKRYTRGDLEKVILYKSASLDKGGIPLTPMESYHYARIIPKQGEEIILTCLMAPDVEEAIKQIKWIPCERKKRGFASLNFSIRLLSDK